MSGPTGLHSVPGAFNLRDLGGNPVEGGIISPGRVFRGDLLHRIDAAHGARWLSERDVRTLIDLRTVGEREGDGFMAASTDLDSLHRGLLDEVWSWEAEDKATNEWFLRDRTIEMYERFPDRIVQVLGDIAAAPANVLFHCTAGKDRTGVIASALLGVLGADRDVIVADYARSTQAMVEIIAWYRNVERDRAALEARTHPEREQEALDRVAADPGRERRIVERAAAPATMAGVVDAIVDRHGSFAGWASDVGVGPELIDALRAKLVVPAT